MNINDFIAAIEEEFDDLEPGTLKPATRFRELEGWSSMLALIIIARIDSEYDVTVTAEELAGAQTITDLFELVNTKVA